MNAADKKALERVSRTLPGSQSSGAVVLVTGPEVHRFAYWESRQTARYYVERMAEEQPRCYRPSGRNNWELVGKL